MADWRRPPDATARRQAQAALNGTRREVREEEMDPLGSLIVSLGALIVLDLAALRLGVDDRRRRHARHARR